MTAPNTCQNIHFVTGKLAEPALRKQVDELAREFGFHYTIDVLPISVAALLHVDWVAPRLQVPADAQLVVLPGYCQGDLNRLQQVVTCPLLRGPRDLRRLPELFGKTPPQLELREQDIQIIAEINHAPRLSRTSLLTQAQQLSNEGADFIDIGCEPGQYWSGVGDAVRAVRDLGLRVSIDSLNIREISDAVAAGAELVLSVNSSNRHAAVDWDAEVIAIPDEPRNWESLVETVETLTHQKVRFRIDPILEPIGMGFAESLRRYLAVREAWPDAEMMMGIGNLTELSDVDSAGVNFLLAGFCQEVGVRSVLTTQVIAWARSSVRELEIARRLVHYSVQHQVPPKRLSEELIQLRDPRLVEHDREELIALASSIKDPNYRIFNVGTEIFCMGGGNLWIAEDPFELFQQMLDSPVNNLDASHSFYLGFEMAKAMLAGQLGKNYNQDQALHWGHLTREEPDRHYLRTRKSGRRS